MLQSSTGRETPNYSTTRIHNKKLTLPWQGKKEEIPLCLLGLLRRHLENLIKSKIISDAWKWKQKTSVNFVQTVKKINKEPNEIDDKSNQRKH